jgi:bifunctional oligoribonuclease and PAP phosphatase NrnA
MYFPKLSENFKNTIASIRNKKVAVIGHMRPDGDCIGSQVGLSRMLNDYGIEAIAVNKDVSPRILKKFIGDTPFITADEFKNENHIPILCDCADFKRQGERLAKIFSETFICVDHHISNIHFAKHNFIDSNASATAEILAGMFLDNKMPIDALCAQALYVGIATDTGQFCYPSTTTRVFNICAELCKLGADPGAATSELYEKESFAKVKLLQQYLSTLKLELDGQVCIGYLKSEQYDALGLDYDDSEGFVNYARCINDVKIGLLLEQRKSLVKGSFRAKSPSMRVDKMATSFGGGGHACAAGFSVETDIETIYPEILKLLKKHISEIPAT